MPTYKDISNIVKQQYGYIPKPCWIAHVKELQGLSLRKAHNRIDRNKRKYPCPPGKINEIVDAMKELGMLKR